MYKFAFLDPRASNDQIFSQAQGVMGIEVTISSLADRCGLGNIDPQHGCHREIYDNGGFIEAAHSSCLVDETAIEFAVKMRKPPERGWVPTMFPPKESTLVTIRPDLDSVGSMAVINLRAKDVSLEPAMGRIALVAIADKFARGGWPGPKALPTKNKPWDELIASVESSRMLAVIAAAVADFKVPLADRVATMERWLLTGEEPAQYHDQVEGERLDMIAALESGAIKYGVCSGGKIAVVESVHRAATSVGYSLAPVVVAFNPSFKSGLGEPYRKFTVCVFEAKFADIKSALAELATLESGWGGSPTIGGSPQGTGSFLTTDQVVEVVARHLLY